MLRKFAYNKIFRTTGMLVLFLLLLLFPASNKYSLEEDHTLDVIKKADKEEGTWLFSCKWCDEISTRTI